MNDLVVEHVLRAVECVPPGRVVSYGAIGALVGVGPRQVGAVLREYGGGVTWWRVTNAYGDLTPELLRGARPHWAQEGILVKRNGRGCVLADHRVDEEAWSAAYRSATADLPPCR
ncbi:MGMT family protein [Mobilicoccus sp.]|uniref:MGMT family protein n=1 Tax=Mobilicoccus sp. TaxID=2034349 RepID=UPI0028971FC4|nr:MGMT family protein [Mobilicoccus sp.]